MEFLTVAEFAKRSGISKQTIYNRLNNEYLPFVVIIKGIRHLRIDDNGNLCASEESNAVQTDFLSIGEEMESKETRKRNNELELQIAQLQKRIEELEAENRELKTANQDKESRLLTMMEKVIELTNQAQILTANSQKVIMQPQKPKLRLLEWFKPKPKTKEDCD